MKYSSKIQTVWNKASICNCGNVDCTPNNHRLCAICGYTILYGSHESEESQRNSHYAWNIDHINPKAKNGNNNINNLQAVHISCNRIKSHY